MGTAEKKSLGRRQWHILFDWSVVCDCPESLPCKCSEIEVNRLECHTVKKYRSYPAPCRNIGKELSEFFRLCAPRSRAAEEPNHLNKGDIFRSLRSRHIKYPVYLKSLVKYEFSAKFSFFVVNAHPS